MLYDLRYQRDRKILTGIEIGRVEFTKVLSDNGRFSNDSSIIQLQSLKIR